MDVIVKTTPSFNKKLNKDWKEMTSKCLEAVCQECLNRMKEEVPVDTGALQASLTTNFTNQLEKQITSDVEYWKYVNYGTSRMSANPYIERSVDGLDVDGIVEKVVLKTLRESGAI